MNQTISPERMQILEIQWFRLFDGLGISARHIYTTFDRLIEAYSSESRYYHNLSHLIEMFKIAGKLIRDADNPPAVFLAIWFHDAIYDSQASDNEMQSARFAEIELQSIGIDMNLIQAVSELILATADPTAETVSADAAVLLDADLAILGADAKRYQAYREAIRREYAWVSDADFTTGRRAILQRFLAMPRIYRTAALFETGETSARENITTELQTLG